jgi:hypothetical protein
MTLRRSLLIAVALVPALAVAAPRSKKKPKPKKKAAATKPVETTEPAAPTPDPETPPTTDAKSVGPTTPASPTVPATSSGTSGTTGGGAGGTGTGGGAGGGSGASIAEPAAATDPAPSAHDPDVDTLRQEYLSLRDELFKSRARANTVASQLYSTRVQIKLTYTSVRFYNPAKASIRLDGATVYENGDGGIGGDDGVRFDGYIAPGRHLITFHVEATGKDDDSFTSVIENQIVIKAVGGKDLLVVAKAHDGGDIAYEWKRKERGTYGLGVDVIVKTVPRADTAKAATK